MKIDITSLCFGFKIEKDNDSGTAAWATSIGQAPKDICYIDTNREGLDEIVYGMMYKSHSDFENLKVRDVIGLDKREEPRGDRERMMFSVFEDVYVNNMKVDGIYTLTYEREDTPSHKNRLHICYAKYLTYNGHTNKATLKEMAKKLGCSEDACWFVTDITIRNQKCLHFTAIVVNPEHLMIYQNSKERKRAWDALIPEVGHSFNNHQIVKPLQEIFYGAPGTGKSHRIKEQLETLNVPEKNIFRTTFHPDSDYATFVGAYKPTMKSSERIYTPEELTVKLKEIKTTGTTYPCHKFAARYWESIKDLSPDSIKQILNACGFIDNYSVEVGKGVAIGQEYLNKPEDGKIIYNFCPQTFTNAYVEAWKTEEKVFLVIEEINRGNCAQIFGDLFQLLDRENGISEYSVDADVDLQSYLQKALAESKRDDIPEEVKSGKKLMLPSNLYIWATMNTSDQSLFPIDSAFKRRWDWKYVKIKDEHKDWTIDIDIKTKDSAGNETTAKLDWYVFIDKINEIIASMTSSADKQLGYFFCKPKTKDSKEIDVETFVSKVIFYLWNDVFKDYAFEDASLFQYTTEVNGNKETKDLTFPDFYNDDESINTTCLTDFIEKVMNWKKGNEDKE